MKISRHIFQSYAAPAAFVLLAVNAVAGVRDPFPPGFSMGTLGAVVDERGASGREPWTSATLCADSSGFGFAVSGTSYYNSVGGGMGGDGIGQATGGGRYSTKYLTCKAAIAHLNDAGAYFEQSGFLSVASGYFPFVRLGIEATGYRLGVRLPNTPVRTIGEGGLSAWIPWSWAAISLRLEHLVLAASRSEGADPPVTIRCGINAARNGFGGQGVLVTIVPDEPRPVGFTIGEEYRITPEVAFQAAFSNNPVLLSFGMEFCFGRPAVSVALVNNSVLGWSQGFGAEYHRR